MTMAMAIDIAMVFLPSSLFLPSDPKCRKTERDVWSAWVDQSIKAL